MMVPDSPQAQRQLPTRGSFKFVGWLSVIGLAAGAVASLWQLDLILWEKLITDALLPCSGLCLVLWGLAARTWCSQKRTGAISLTLVALAYTLAGNPLVGSALMRTLEYPFIQLRPLEGPPFDVVVVLGGSTNTAPNGIPQLGSSAGDRVLLAARLYHRGKAKQLVCTGVPLTTDVDRRHAPAYQTRAILVDLGIPDQAIVMGQGRNTYEEMQYLRQNLPPRGQHGRVGILTSAWHMPRALRLARQAGLTVEPVPADFASLQRDVDARNLLPNPDGFRMVQAALREYLAALVRR